MSIPQLRKKPSIFNYGGAVGAWKNVASEYSTVFKNLPSVPPTSIYPTQNEEFIYNPESTFASTSLYKQNYVKHPKAIRYFKRKSNLKLGSGDGIESDSKTTYTSAFVPKSTETRSLILPNPIDNQIMERGSDYENNTSLHRSEYRRFSLPEFKEAKQKSFPGMKSSIFCSLPNEEKLSFTTTSGFMFKDPQKQVRNCPIVHQQEIKQSTSEMVMQTTQKSDFIPKQVEKKNQVFFMPRERKKEEWFEVNDPGVYNPRSTSQDDFQRVDENFQRPKSFKPCWKFSQPDDGFPQLSVYSEDFIKLSDNNKPTRVKHQQSCLKLNSDPSILPQTSYNEKFVKHNEEKYKRSVSCVPPLGQVFPPATKFCGDTSYTVSYVKILPQNIVKVQNFKRPTSFSFSTEKFSTETTSNAHFRGLYEPPPQLIKPMKQKVDFAFPLEPV